MFDMVMANSLKIESYVLTKTAFNNFIYSATARGGHRALIKCGNSGSLMSYIQRPWLETQNYWDCPRIVIGFFTYCLDTRSLRWTVSNHRKPKLGFVLGMTIGLWHACSAGCSKQIILKQNCNQIQMYVLQSRFLPLGWILYSRPSATDWQKLTSLKPRQLTTTDT